VGQCAAKGEYPERALRSPRRRSYVAQRIDRLGRLPAPPLSLSLSLSLAAPLRYRIFCVNQLLETVQGRCFLSCVGVMNRTALDRRACARQVTAVRFFAGIAGTPRARKPRIFRTYFLASRPLSLFACDNAYLYAYSGLVRFVL